MCFFHYLLFHFKSSCYIYSAQLKTLCIRNLTTILITKMMKNIISMLRSEIYSQFLGIDNLVKAVTVSQDSYLKDRTNKSFFNIWSENVKKLQKAESDIHYMHSAYVTLCEGCGIEPMSVEDIVAEKKIKAQRRALNKDKKKEGSSTNKES